MTEFGSSEKLPKAVRDTLTNLARVLSTTRLPLEALLEHFATEYRESEKNITQTPPCETDLFAAAQVITEWHENHEFLAANGLPKALSLSNGQFRRLCNAAAPSADPLRILELLTHVNAVSLNDDALLATRRDLIVGDGHPAAVRRATEVAAGFTSTLAHNLIRSVAEPSRFERTAVQSSFSNRDLPGLYAYLSMHGGNFLEELDAWMAKRVAKSEGKKVGVGIYFFVESNSG